MRKWQKYLLIGIIVFSVTHLLRDLLQEFEVELFLTEVLTKKDVSKVPSWYWTIPNSYYLETLAILFAVIALYKKSFKPFGILSILVLLMFFTLWIIYWFAF